MPASHVRVIATPCGGGFGGKCDPFNHEIIVCKLAMVTGRPVKICLTREEVFYCHRGRHPVLMKTQDRIQERRLHHRHASQHVSRRRGVRRPRRGHHVLHRRAEDRDVQIPQYKFEAARVFTNKAPVRSQARTRHAASRASRWKSRWTRSPSNSGSIPAEMRKRHMRFPPTR